MKRLALICPIAALLLASCSWRIVSVYENPLTAVAPTPTLAASDLSGPGAQVGSTYAYVNDTLLVAVPAGGFTMGHGGADNPVHQVTLDGFWIFRTKVTNGQYARCADLGLCTPPEAGDDPGYADPPRRADPVVGLTYDQAATYCGFMRARLPSEAEWEKAARGPGGNLYPWGNGAPSCDLLNFNACVGNTTDVAAYPHGRSYYGALDMEGNAFEWVADWYDALYYLDGPAQNPPGPELGRSRSVRSSGYMSAAPQTSAALRFFDSPLSHRPDLGFRCVVVRPVRFALPAPPLTPTSPSTASPTSTPLLTSTLLPTLSAPSLSPTQIPILKPTLIPAPVATLVKDACQIQVCTLPYLWNAIKCKCVLP
jgi:formylglycine-generating enzyme required for sulfatase activity